jgi:KUP system potassium uptake protein
MTAAVQPGPYPKPPLRRDLIKLAAGAVGIVYGDIGTSPLYAIKECFTGEHAVEVSHANVLGVLSLVFWSLLLVVVIKYLAFVVSADHDGEGGILALLALATRQTDQASRKHLALVLLGLAGAALLYGDGIITPAISVLSAVEGLEVATPVFRPYIIPITVVVLISLFLVQKRGTGGIGMVFGPVTMVWFLTIAAAGLPWILREPAILLALNPAHALAFLWHHGLHGLLVLGAVVLCITGAEALYADLGHFGAGPIRLAWFCLVFPALLINYFGQGALLLSRGAEAAAHPFYQMVPAALLYPTVGIATAATVIASQALISGAFSLTQQAVQLGYLPRVRIVHTSGSREGQIFIPQVNTLLMISCVALVLAFRESTHLAAAYGIAVTGTMTITSILFFMAIKKRWGTLPAGLLTAAFLLFDLAFFAGNVGKIPHGGWFSILVAAVMFSVMATWRRGRLLLRRSVMDATLPLDAFLQDLQQHRSTRVPGTAVFLALNPDIAPAALLHNFKHSKVVHEQVVILTIQTRRVPEVPDDERLTLLDRGQGFFQALATYGFMQRPHVPELIELCRARGLQGAGAESYYLSRETLRSTGRSGLSSWRLALFAFLSRNAHSVTDYFGIPANRVVELGMQVEL